MPRPIFHHKGGARMILCGNCELYLTNQSELVSSRFQGSTGKASLYARVWNIKTGKCDEREMMTGFHVVRDVHCLRCNSKLGWMYEYALEEDQRYKEAKVILERALIEERDGMADPVLGRPSDSSSYRDDKEGYGHHPVPICVPEPLEGPNNYVQLPVEKICLAKIVGQIKESKPDQEKVYREPQATRL